MVQKLWRSRWAWNLNKEREIERKENSTTWSHFTAHPFYPSAFRLPSPNLQLPFLSCPCLSICSLNGASSALLMLPSSSSLHLAYCPKGVGESLLMFLLTLVVLNPLIFPTTGFASQTQLSHACFFLSKLEWLKGEKRGGIKAQVLKTREKHESVLWLICFVCSGFKEDWKTEQRVGNRWT